MSHDEALLLPEAAKAQCALGRGVQFFIEFI
jgi:hypothetical protein